MPFWLITILVIIIVLFIAFIVWMRADDYYNVNGQPGENAYRIINNTVKDDLLTLHDYILGEDSHHAEHMSTTEYAFYEVNLMYLMYVADKRIFVDNSYQFGNVIRTLTKRPAVVARSAHSFAHLLQRMASAMPELYTPETITKYQVDTNDLRKPTPQYN